MPGPSSPTPGPSGGAHAWTDQIADKIEAIVAAVRDRTTIPATKVVRAIVFGLVAAALGTVALVVLIIGMIRLHVYLPFHPEGRRVWVTYAALGGLFVLLGMVCWRKRVARSS